MGDTKKGRTNPNPNAERRSVSFRVSLLRSIILLILALSVAILAVSIVGARRAMRTLCQDLVLGGTDRLETELRRFFEPIPRYLLITRDWARRGLYDDFDPDRMLSLFGPYLEKSPQVSSLNTGDVAGRGFMLLYDGESWRSRTVEAEGGGRRAHWRKWTALDGTAEEWTEESAYDPRGEPWFRSAAAEGAAEDAIFWTEPHTFATTEEPGITASIRARDPAGKPMVVSADLLLRDISRITTNFRISPNGFVVVTTGDVRSIGLPSHPKFVDPAEVKAAFLKNPRDLGIPLFTAASDTIRGRFHLQPGKVLEIERGRSKENRPFRWEFEGKAWWTYVRPCLIEDGPQLWIAVAVPEDDFLGELREGRSYYFGLAAIALLVAAFVSFKLARRYSTPIHALIEQSDRLRNLDTTGQIGPGNSGIREIAQLYDAQERMRLALDSFARYVPGDVVRELLDKGEAAVIGGRNTSMSILFTDIEGFTAIAESMSPGELTKHMASYFDAMLGIIAANSGTVDKLIGDAIVAFWGAPKSNAHHARDAVRAALACHEKLEELNRMWEFQGLPRLPTRFGISTGEVVVGNVGSAARLSYTALGDAVNLASRLEGANNIYGTRILASAATAGEAGDEFVWRRLDKVGVKGRSEPEIIHELIGKESATSDDAVRFARQYEAAFDQYLGRRFEEALESLQELERIRRDDRSVERLINQCDAFLQNPPAENWDGVSRFTTKA